MSSADRSAMPPRFVRLPFGPFVPALNARLPVRQVRAKLGLLIAALAAVPAFLALSGAAEQAGAQTTFTCSTATPSNNCAMAITGSATGTTTTPAGLSSSYLTVSGATGPVTSVQVVLNGVTSSIGDWAGYNENNENVYSSVFYTTFVLEDPAGNQLALLGSTGSGYDAMNGVTITIKDGATVAPPLNEPNYGGAWPNTGSITVAPGSYWELENIVPLYDAAPGDLPQTDGSATLTSKFTGATANGTWTLHLADSDQTIDYPLYVTDPVSISGWQLILTYSTLPSTTTTVSSSTNPTYTASTGNSTLLTASVTSSGEPIGGGTVAFTANNSPIACTGGNQTVSGGTATCDAVFTAEGNYSIGASYSGTSSYAPSSGGGLYQLAISHTTNPSTNTYCNPGDLTTTGYTSTDLVYPSYIQVPSGVSQTVANVSVQLNGLQSTNGALSGDVSSSSFLLVSPNETNNLDFLSHGVTGNPQPSVDVTFADGDPLVPNGEGENGGICNGGSGPNCDLQNDTTYGPTDDSLTSDSFITQAGSPAPPSPNYPLPYGSTNAKTFEQAFSGATAAGNWLLYIENDGGIPLSLSGGWCIDLTLNTGAATTTTVTSGMDQAPTGTSVNFTATVQSGGDPVTTGSVTFLDNGAPPAGGNNVIPLSGSDQAVFSTSQLTEGDHKITASYSGASGYDPSSNFVWQRIDDTTVVSNVSGNAAQFCNTGAVLTAEGQIGAYTPDPSNIFVKNLPGTVSSVSLTLDNFYTFSDQIYATESMVEGPTGAALDFFSNTGASNTVLPNPGNYIFTDSASGSVPDTSNCNELFESTEEPAICPGSYKPTSYANINGTADSFFASPGGFYTPPGTFDYAGTRGSSTFNSAFANTNPNGTWSLYFDQLLHGSPAGAQNGWCLSFVEIPPAVAVVIPETSTFSQGQQGASFTVDITNNGPGSTGDASGTAANPMTVTDVLNGAFTYAGSSGTGWTCAASSQTVTCKNDSAIPDVAESNSYPELTIDVNVSGTATGTISNSVTASGAGAASTNSNMESITIQAPASLSVTKSHTGTFTQASPATWNIQVNNTATGSTSGTINVSDTLPTNYTLASYSGTGWTCSGTGTSAVACSSTTAIAGGSSSTISLVVNVPAASPTSVTNTASAWGGGDLTHTNSGSATTGTDPSVPVVQVPASISINGMQTQSAATGTAFGTLAVTIKDAAGVTIPNYSSVTFTAVPAGGASGTFSNSTGTTTLATDGSGVANPGTFTANATAGGPYLVTVSAGSAPSVSFSLTNTSSTVSVAIGTSPSGLGFSIGGVSYTTTQTPSLTIGTGYALLTTSPQNLGVTGVQYAFSRWSDGATTLSDTLTPSANTTSDTAMFTTQYLLTVSAGTGGTIAAATAPNGFYNATTSQTIAATPSTGYYFVSWTGANSPTDIASATSATTTVTMNAPETLTANFAPIPGYIVGTLNDDASGDASNCPAAPSVGSSCTLRDAITAADVTGGNITFNSGLSGTITLGSALPALTGQITITGPGANVITVSGISATVGSMFTVNSGATVGISGLTIANGNAAASTLGFGGGIFNEGGALTVSDCVLSNNTASNNGGGIYSEGTLTVTNSTFSTNTAASGDGANGGGIFSLSGTLTVNYSTFSGNTANGHDGGAIFADNPANISNSTFSGNQADAGGAIASLSGTMTVANSIFSGNSATLYGAGLLNGAPLNATGNLFYNNLFYNNLNGGTTEGDCFNCTPTSSVSGNPNLAALGNYGGPTPTMLPLPASAAICAASSALVPGGFTMDQRGDPNFATYNSTKCYDLGAVQTNYALSFTTNPPATGTVPGTAMSPAPVVTVTESGTALTGAR
jgi:CSLREA domain-containing protein